MAVRFVENKWSVKSMIRTMMLSSAYRQTSMRSAPKKEEKADPDNHLLWRQNRKRLEGDILRDSVLALSRRQNLGAPWSRRISAPAGRAEGSHDDQESSRAGARRTPRRQATATAS